MSETEKRTRRAASYAGAVAWVVANSGNESIQSDPDLWAQFISDVFKRPLEDVNAALNAGVKTSSSTVAETETVDA